ncbi:MAG TPA: N-6 DNA methylase [Candidatus Lokiarchaeia archaeon]|nr:N-6 DNA methylase [Candidatus Lokiarchaeia archaeon]
MPSVNISEYTDRPEFIDCLKQKLGIQFRIFQELVLNNLKEDIMIFKADAIDLDLENNTLTWKTNDAVIAVIETKVRGEKNLEQYEDQLTKYMKEFKCKIGFISNYNDIIFYGYSPDIEIQDKELFSSEAMSDLADYIANIIQKNTNITFQKTSEEIIKLLENSINDLIKYTERIPGEDWEHTFRVSDESERDTKESEISSEEKEDRDVFFQRSAAYIAIAQILFYVIFRIYRIDQNINQDPRLRPLSSSNGIPTQIQEIISDIPNNNLNFKTILGKNREVFSRLDDDAASVLKEVIHDLEGLSARFVIENDLIGQIFQRLMPFEVRKKFAAFYTLPKAAELLCKLAIKNADMTVYDPACGSGTLLVQAYNRKKQLGLNQHKQILEQIKGSDISDIATMMSTVNLAIQDPSKWTNEISIFPHDAFELILGLTRFLPPSQETPDGRKSISPIFSPDKDYRVDVLLANPPFTRGSRLSNTTKDMLKKLDMVEKYKLKPSFAAMNLYAFFLLIAPSLVKAKNGNIAFILPLGAINSKSMIPVWKVLFKENFGMKFVIEASDIDESFSDSQDQEIIVVMGKNFQEPVRLVKLFGELDKKDIDALVNELELVEKPFEKTDDFLIQVIPQTEFQSLSCIGWRINPSKTMVLLYSQFLPLDKKELEDSESEQYTRDLSELIQARADNASRPVDYWFLPNKFWNIASMNEETITIQATSENTIISKDPKKKQLLDLPKKYFLLSMANSLKDYQDYPPIIPNDASQDLFLVYKHESEKEMQEYYNWGQEAHASDLFGSDHSGRTPYLYSGGIVTKINYLNVKTIALRFSTPIVGRRILRNGFFGNQEDSDLFFAYLTSSLFFLDLMEKSRTRCAEFVKIEYTDLISLFRFPDLVKIKSRKRICKNIILASAELNGKTPLKQKLRIIDMISDARVNPNNELRKLDEAWFTALNIPIAYLDTLYQEIDERLKEIVKKR